ncbi:unnamed protein product, partial [Prorocentrum cordatum]
VEDLCGRVRAQAEATIAAAEAWSEVQLGGASGGLRLFSGPAGSTASCLVEAVQAEVQDADQMQAAASSLLASRVRDEVLAVLDERLREHELVREDVRERHRLQSSAAAARRDLAWLRKGSVGSSGLKSLGSSTPDGPVREAEKRLTEAAVRLAARDEQLLERLSRLSMLRPRGGCERALGHADADPGRVFYVPAGDLQVPDGALRGARLGLRGGPVGGGRPSEVSMRRWVPLLARARGPCCGATDGGGLRPWGRLRSGRGRAQLSSLGSGPGAPLCPFLSR